MMRIAVIPNNLKDPDYAVTKKIVEELDGKAEIITDGYSDERTKAPDGCIYDCCDVVIVIGGDGTIINSAVECAERNIPILGVNLGRVGFMSELEVSDIKDGIGKLLSGDYIPEERMMIEIDIIKSDGTSIKLHALNDAVVQKTGSSKLIGLELYSDGEKISRYISDGLIISTPTGSTGYNLSAGGPVVNPLMSLYIATAICPHMLSSRPVVLPAEAEISIKSDKIISGFAEIVVDGESVCGIGPDDVILIRKSKYTTKLIRTVKRSFYDTMTEKLS